MNVKTLRSEIERITNTLVDGMQCQEMILPSRVEAIITRLQEYLYPAADSIEITTLRRDILEDLDRILYASEQFLEGVDSDFLEERVTSALDVLNQNTVSNRLNDIVTEELVRAQVTRFNRTQTRRLIKEEPDIQAGNIEKYANDSLDVAVDSYFDKVGDTLDASGQANKEPNQDGAEGEQEFSAVDFASDISNLVDRTETLLDLRGTIARRAINHVTEKYGADAGKNVKQILSANFDIEIDTSNRDAEAQRNETRPAAIGAGGGGGGGGGA